MFIYLARSILRAQRMRPLKKLLQTNLIPLTRILSKPQKTIFTWAISSLHHEISVAIKVCADVINMSQKWDFRLTKYISNNCSILQSLPKNNVSPKLTEIILPVNYIPIERALGILWNPEMDTFYIKYTIKSVIAVKRGILSLISSIFDPLGLIAPALIEPKWIIKQLWKRKTD